MLGCLSLKQLVMLGLMCLTCLDIYTSIESRGVMWWNRLHDVFCTTGHLWSWCNMWCWSILSDKIMPPSCRKFSLAFRSLWNVVTWRIYGPIDSWMIKLHSLLSSSKMSKNLEWLDLDWLVNHDHLTIMKIIPFMIALLSSCLLKYWHLILSMTTD